MILRRVCLKKLLPFLDSQNSNTRNADDNFTNQDSSKSRNVTNTVLVEGIKPAVLTKNGLECRGLSKSKALWLSRTIKVPTRGAKALILETNSPPEPKKDDGTRKWVDIENWGLESRGKLNTFTSSLASSNNQSSNGSNKSLTKKVEFSSTNKRFLNDTLIKEIWTVVTGKKSLNINLCEKQTFFEHS